MGFNKRTNRKPMFLLTLTVVIVILTISAILLFRQSTTPTSTYIIDCTPKENEIYNSECMFGAMDSCTPAKATVSGMGITRYTEVKGKTGDNCEIYVSVGYSDGDLYEATCSVPLSLNISKIMSPFRAESVEKYIAGIEKYCNGDWVNLVKSQVEAQGNMSKQQESQKALKFPEDILPTQQGLPASELGEIEDANFSGYLDNFVSGKLVSIREDGGQGYLVRASLWSTSDDADAFYTLSLERTKMGPYNEIGADDIGAECFGSKTEFESMGLYGIICVKGRYVFEVMSMGGLTGISVPIMKNVLKVMEAKIPETAEEGGDFYLQKFGGKEEGVEVLVFGKGDLAGHISIEPIKSFGYGTANTVNITATGVEYKFAIIKIYYNETEYPNEEEMNMLRGDEGESGGEMIYQPIYQGVNIDENYIWTVTKKL